MKADATTLIKAFAKKQLTPAQLSKAFDRLIETSDDPAAIQTVLERARAAGLPSKLYVHLAAKLPPRNDDGTDGDPTTGDDLTAEPEPLDVKTRIRRSTKRRPTDDGEPTEDPNAPLAAPTSPGATSSAATATPSPRLRPPPPIDSDPTDAEDDLTEINPDEPSGPLINISSDATDQDALNESTTMTDWGKRRGKGAPEYTAGSMLRGRFRLLTPLGEGGMGTVWKAVDLLKEEARDRNPYVAIKLLQGDFREHPEAFIALQRETAKAQRLAHPNIATTFDFDRDDQTGTVYMTMEVLEGDDLAGFIRSLPPGGLAQEEAMYLVEQLAAGLAYAHENKLVHSDLKPGNCFITNEKTVKLLDFGIARASKTRMDAEGETTLFDPGELGALTPTYATIEMFDGLDPDPRDDIYALAIITYQLLTGRHPYNRKSAPKARELELTVDPVPGLSKRQNRVLARSLAFAREDRTASVDELLEGLRPKKTYTKQISIAAVVGLLALGLGIYPTVTSKLRAIENAEVIAEIAKGNPASMGAGLARLQTFENAEQRSEVLSDAAVRGALVGYIAKGDERSINTGLGLIAPFPDEWQRSIRETDAAREAIFEMYANRVTAVVDPNANRYDFPAAQSILDELAKLYVDSAQVLQLRQDLQREKDSLLNNLNVRFNAALSAGALLPSEGGDDVADVLDIVRQVSPSHPLLTDPRLPLRFEELARTAVEEDTVAGYERANQLLDASREFAPADPSLGNLRFKVESKLQQIRDQALTERLVSSLTGAEATLRRLPDYAAIRDEMTSLADIAPNHPVLLRLQTRLTSLIDRSIARARTPALRTAAERAVFQYAPLMTVQDITKAKSALAERSPGTAPAAGTGELREARLQTLTDAVASSPSLSADWERGIHVPLKELLALSAPEDPDVEAIRARISNVFVTSIQTAREANRFAEARAVLDAGEALHADFSEFKEERRLLQLAENAVREAQAAARRAAEIDGLKRTLIAQANANEPVEAQAVLNRLQGQLAPNDPFLAAEAPQAIAKSYENLAATTAKTGQWSAAVKLAQAGLALAPTRTSLTEDLRAYRAALKKEEAIAGLKRRFAATGAYSVRELKSGLDALRRDFPERFSELNRSFGAAMAESVGRSPTQSANDVTRAASRLSALKEMYPARHRSVFDRVIQQVVASVRSRERTDPRAAQTLLAASRSAFANPPGLAAMTVAIPAKPSPLAEKGLADVNAGNLTSARKTLAAVERQTPDAANLPALRRTLDERTQQADAAFQNYQRYVAAQREREGRPYLQQARRLWRDNPDSAWNLPRPRSAGTPTRGECTEALAGLGKGRGICFDRVSNARGPTLVVIPRTGSLPAFAIGKYEVSIAEFNAYCADSGACATRARAGKSPVTSLSVADARAYVSWLSTKTGQRYRLPTDSEWEVAANANGVQPKNNFNCTVKLGAKIIKGQDLVNARSGDTNGWGLANYVGNAQEWTVQNGALVARGGAHTDALSRCDLSLRRAHGGQPDPVTGFRVVRELSPG